MEKKHEADERMRTMFDVTPFGANFWNKNMELIDINEATVNLLKLSNKKEYIENVNAFSPKYQPDGRLSTEAAAHYFRSVVKKGHARFEWMYQAADGTQVPCETIMIRVEFKGEFIIAEYLRDLREYKQMMADIAKRDQLLSIVNRLAEVLLAVTSEESFQVSLLKGMELIGQSLNADCVQIWPNETRDGVLHFVLGYKWLSEDGLKAPAVEIGTPVPYSKRWLDLFRRGENVNGPIESLPQEDQDLLSPLGLISTITLPLYYQGEFWGVFCVDDCVKKRYFTESEINILKSASLMLVNAINRNLQATQIKDTARELEIALEKTEDSHKQNEIQLVKLNMVLTGTKIALWDVEIDKDNPMKDSNTIIYSQEFRQMLGYSNEADFPNVLSSWSKLLHPDDKEVTLKSLANYLMDTTGKVPYDVEFRLLKKDGEYSYYRASGQNIRDKEGNSVRVVGSLMDITETKNILLDTERQRIEAEAANQAKSAFLSTMSHEIRTPMNAILGITEILLQGEGLQSSTREGLEKIYSSGDMLLGIINDILDMSKIEAGKMELLVSNYETASLISDTAQVNMMRIGSKPIEFELEIDVNTPAALSGDELRVKQILNNLLSNAFKYTAEGTVKMTVYAKPIDGRDNEVTLVVGISDTGQGMTKEQISKLFEEYSRFNQTANRSTEGTGLGMSIARNLIHMMRGEITIESESGKGSTFTIFLPQGRVNSNVLGEDIVKNLHKFRTSSRSQMKRVQIQRDPMPYGSVLIVDDVETNIFVAKGLLAPYELKIDSTDSGFGAIEKTKCGNVYDIIFMDHMMPVLDGIETTKRLRKAGYQKPIVALTANAVAGQADIFLGNGFDDYISKPIDIRQLNAVLNKLIRDKQPPEVVKEARQREPAKNKHPLDDILPGVDTSRFTEIFIRDANKAIAILDDFIKKGSSYSEEDLRTFVIYTHGVKSALANWKRMDLAAIALRLEQLGRDNDYEAISAETPDFINQLRDCVNDLKPQADVPTVEAADEDKPFLKDKLLAIKAACGDFDKHTAEDALNELRKKVWSKQAKQLLETIAELLLHSEFDGIVDAITAFMET